MRNDNLSGLSANPPGVFVHDRGLCEAVQVGEGTKIWAFAHVLPGAVIGKNCNICDNVFIENDVIVGDEVTVKCGVQLWDGVRLGDRVFVGPNATFTNDRFPRSKQYLDEFAQTIIDDDASIGANATILPGVSIGRGAMIGAGSVITKNVPAFAVVVGNPGKIIGYQTRDSRAPSAHDKGAGSGLGLSPGSVLPLGVGECALYRLPHFSDLRGSLVPVEFQTDLPFIPKRSFLVFGVPSDKVRGEHAHRECGQFLVAVSGSVSVVVDDGEGRQEVLLDSPSVGLYLRPWVWGIQYKFSRDAVLMVMASHAYSSVDYIRDYATFTAEVATRAGS